MKSRKTVYRSRLSPIALSLLMSGCLMGENKTFFDYGMEESETEDLGNPSNSTVGIPSLPSSSETSSGSTLCCNVLTASLVPASPIGCQQGLGLMPVTDSNECHQLTLSSGRNVIQSIERYPISSSSTKKIDFLFVVDNSGSMEDNQRKLASGFESFANTFFRREDLDICISIITSDRYRGRGGDPYPRREMTIPCTKPATWPILTPTQRSAHIDRVISDFREGMNVGTRGSSLELVGKSLVTYLHNLEQWDDSRLNERSYHGFFRRESIANISILTDENNWFYRDPQREEWKNDLPVVRNAPIYNASTPMVDSRKGIKDHLDEYFSAVQPDHAPSWSVNTFLETTRGPVGIPALAMNLDLLSALTGRESAKTDIGQNATGYTNLYQSVSTNLVNRAEAVQLNHAVIGIESVVLIYANQVREPLLAERDYTLLEPNGIVLSSTLRNRIASGDEIEITYRHLDTN